MKKLDVRLRLLDRMEPARRSRWIRLWDTSSYIGSAAMPILLVNGSSDRFYPLDSLARTIDRLPGRPRRRHRLVRDRQGPSRRRDQHPADLPAGGGGARRSGRLGVVTDPQARGYLLSASVAARSWRVHLARWRRARGVGLSAFARRFCSAAA